MRSIKYLVAAAIALAFSPAFALTPEQYEILFQGVQSNATLTFPSANAIATLNSKTYAPDVYFTTIFDGWTADLSLTGVSPAGVASAYNCATQPANGGCPNFTSPLFTMNVLRPGFTSAGAATTVQTTMQATSWLRQSYPGNALPTESAPGGNAILSLAWDDFLYAADSPSPAVLQANLYYPSGTVGSGLGNAAVTTVPVTNNSVKTYPMPIGAWVTEPGLEIASGQNFTVEFYCEHAYARNGQSCAAVKFTASDGTNTVSHTISAMTPSVRQWSTTCTAANGSNVLQNCGSVIGLYQGERVTVNYSTPGTGGGAVEGQPEVGTIATTSGTYGDATCTTAPCIILGQGYAANALSATPKTTGSISISATPPVGEGMGDGAYVGNNIYNTNLGTNPANIVKPSANCAASCGSTGTSITLPTPSAGGQWMVNQYLINATCLNYQSGHYIVSQTSGTTGGAGVYVLSHAPSANNACTGAGTIQGNAVANNVPSSQSTVPSSIEISTSATSGTASASTTYIHHNYQGTAGTVTVTKGVPVPVFKAVFTSGELSGLNQGAILVNAIGYPIIGNVTLNTENGADGTGCDSWYTNPGVTGSGTCNSSNAAWFGSASPTTAGAVASAQKNSPNLHDLWAYNDKAGGTVGGIYKPVFAWISGTAGGSPAIQTSSADPGSTAYYANFAAAQTAAKSFNNNSTNRGTAHNDINGVVFCYVAAGSPYVAMGTTATVTAGFPDFRLTSAKTGSACPVSTTPGVASGYGGDPSNVSFANDASASAARFHISNVTLAMTTSPGLAQNSDILGSGVFQTAFLQSFPVFDGIYIPSSAAGYVIYRNGGWAVYNSYLTPGAAGGGLYGAQSVGLGTVFLGNYIIQGTFTTGQTYINPSNFLGNVFYNSSILDAQSRSSSTYTWATHLTSEVIAFDHATGSTKNGSLFTMAQADYRRNNIVIDTLDFEASNYAGSGAMGLITADSDLSSVDNIVMAGTDWIGQRVNGPYDEGASPAFFAGASGAGGTLATGSYLVQTTESCITGQGPTCNSSTETSTDGPPTSTNISVTLGQNITVPLPCDTPYLWNIYVDTTVPATHIGHASIGSVSGTINADALNLAGCQTITINSNATSRTPPQPVNYLSGTYPAAFHWKTNFFKQGNVWTNPNWKADGWSGAPAAIARNGSRIGTFQSLYGVGNYGEIALTNPIIAPTMYPPNSHMFTGPNSQQSVVPWHSANSQGTTDYFPVATNFSDHCPDDNTNVANSIPSGKARQPWDIQGNPRKNDGTGNSGPYEGYYANGCY